MARVGRSLQLIGLVLLPLACVWQLVGGLGRSGGLSEMLLLFGFGVAAFYLGRFLEGYARR